MVQPSVRVPAMAEQNQQHVWNHVDAARSAIALATPSASGAIGGTTSYARAVQTPEVQDKLRSLTADYDGILHDLRKVDAKGVVVAINGKITWADLFASTDLLEKYWQTLIRSYAAESLSTPNKAEQADQKKAQEFLDQLGGNREVIETEPGIYRRAEVTGHGYKVFTLTALSPKLDFDIHVAKMSYAAESRDQFYPYLVH
jgi:hypothetical protein